MEVSYAMGSYIYDSNNKKYLILLWSFRLYTWSPPARVNQAIKDQLDKYSHVMVYGEYSQVLLWSIANY
jgi:adenosylmethionine-8-amino-7-oxononanoate aminotransferase